MCPMRPLRTKAIKYLSLAVLVGLLVLGGLWLRERRPGDAGPDLLDTADALYARASGGQDAKAWGQAARALVAGVRASPGDVRVATLVERVLASPATPHRDHLRLDLAVILDRALEADPGGGFAVSRNLVAVLATSHNRVQLMRAVSLFGKLLPLHAAGPDLQFLWGRTLLRLVRLEEAEAATFKAVKLAQAINNVYAVQRAKNTLGRIYVAQGRHEKARRLFKHAILRQNRFLYHHTDGTHWGCAYQGLGELYSALGRATTEAMVKAQGRVPVPVDERDHASLYAAALVHYHAGNTGQALRYVDRALKLAPRSRYKVLRGFLLLFHKNYAQAKKVFRQAGAVRPAIPGPSAGLGHLAIIRKDYAAARRHLDASLTTLRVSDDYSDTSTRRNYLMVYRMTLMGLGWAAANQNRHLEAVRHFDRILARNGHDLLGLLGKGNSLLGLGRVVEARSVFEQVLKKHPANRYALAELAVIRMSRGDHAGAERGFKKALEQDSQHYTCPYEGLGLLYLRQGKIAAAKKNLQKAIRINPDIEYKKFNALARIYIDEGRPEEAEALLRRSIKNYPHDPEAARLLRRLTALARKGRGVGSPGEPARDHAPGAARFSVVSLGLWMPVDLLVTRNQAELFDYNDHEVELHDRLVRVDGRAVGLDLTGLAPEEAARRLAARPRAAASVRVDAGTLCHERVLRALNAAGHKGLSLTIPDATPADTDLGCLSRLAAGELFLHVDQAGDGALAALAGLKNLRELKLGGRALGDGGLAHLAGLTRLQALTLADTQITDAGVARLARLRGLRRLNLWGTRVTGAGLKHLAGLTALRRLELGGTGIGDQGLGHLAGLQRLTYLGLGSTRVVGPGLASLSALGELETLELWYSDLTDAGLAHIAALPRLRELQIWYTRVTDAGMAHLASAAGLLNLGLGGTGVGDAGLAHLARLRGLKTLDLWGTAVGDAGASHLQALSALEDLSLGGTGVTDAGLARLAGLTRLRRLSLWGTRVTSAGAAHLRRLTALEELELFATRVGDRGLKHLAALTRLRFLELSDTRVTDAGLERLRGLTGLRELELGGTRVTDAGMVHLARLPRLKELGLANNHRVTDAGLAHLAGMKGLRELVLGNTGVTGEGLRHLRGLASLDLLELAGTRVDDAGLVHLRGLARLMYLGLGATRVNGEGLSHLSGLRRLRELELWFTGVDDRSLARLAALPWLCELELSGTKVTDAGLAGLKGNAGLRSLEYGLTAVTAAGIARLRRSLPALEANELASF